MDSFWYLYITERFDAATADRLNRKGLGPGGGAGGRDILQRFGIQERGLTGFVRALRYWPWHIWVGYQIEENAEEVILTVPSCPTQEARLKRGLEEYHCKEMHRLEFGKFAQEVDPADSNGVCLRPPDKHPKEMFCKWRFLFGGK